MAQIGFVIKQANGSYQGQLRTLTIKAPIRIMLNRAKQPETKQPDYLVYSGDVEVGAGWDKIGQESEAPYVGLKLAAPEFGQRPLYANLGQAARQDDPDLFAIIWNPTD